MPNWVSERPWFCTEPPYGAVRVATLRLRARCAAGGTASSLAPIRGSVSRSTEYATLPRGSARSTSVRRRSPVAEETETNSGSTGPADGATGPRTPDVTQAAAASAGAAQATAASARTAIPLGARHPPEPSLSWNRSPQARTARSRPAPANASASPGQARTGPPPTAGVTMSLLTAAAASRPSSAAAHPASTSLRRPLATSATAAARTRPAVTQNGGQPGWLQPGLEEQLGRVGGQGHAPREEQHHRDHGDDRGVDHHPRAAPAEHEGAQSHGGQREHPDKRHESGCHGDQEGGRPGGPPRPATAVGEDARGHRGDQRQQDEHQRRAEAASGDRAHAHRQQRIRHRRPDPDPH